MTAMAETQLVRFSLRRKTAAALAAEDPEAAEPALETDTGNVRLANESGSAWTYYLIAVPITGLTAGDKFTFDGTSFVRVPRQSAIADASAATATSPILTTPTANESELATQIDALIADNASLRSQLNDLLASHRTTGGNGDIAD